MHIIGIIITTQAKIPKKNSFKNIVNGPNIIIILATPNPIEVPIRSLLFL
jgi:hypothetical protein